MNQLIVKGTWKEILALPADHPANECGLLFISEDHRVTTCKSYSDADALNRWFFDATPTFGKKYPVGALLHWSPIGQVSGPHDLAASRQFIDDHVEIVHITD